MTAHVWHQDRKVTGMTDVQRGRYVWGRGYVRSPVGSEVRALRAAYWRARAPATIGDAPRAVGDVAGSRSGWFRQVDEHGKAFGRRYQRLGPVRDVDWPTGMLFLVADQHGNERWTDGANRVRYVDQQPEDYHSYASRVLTRAHKLED